MQFAFIIFLISGFALLIRKLIRFKCYWERLTYGPVRPMNQCHLYDQQYLYLCRKFTFRGEPDEPVNGFYDPVAEFQMQNLDVHVRFASLINQQVLNTEEQADLHAAYIRWQVEMALEQKQLEEKLRADQELTRRQQLQEWEAIKQLQLRKVFCGSFGIVHKFDFYLIVLELTQWLCLCEIRTAFRLGHVLPVRLPGACSEEQTVVRRRLMKTRSRKRSALFAFGLLLMGGLIVTSAGCVWLLEKQRHDALNHQLIEALVQSNYAHAQELVTAGADPNTHIRALPTPGWRELVFRLLHRSPPPENNSPIAFMAVCWLRCLPEHKFSSSFASLLAASQNPQLSRLAQVMITHGANINTRDERGMTPLMMLSFCGITDRAALLLKHGAAVDLQSETRTTALQSAVDGCYPEIVTLLLKYHANPNLKDCSGHTLLWYLLQKTPRALSGPIRLHQQQIIRLLKQAGATQ